jgi:hypothetical protein
MILASLQQLWLQWFKPSLTDSDFCGNQHNWRMTTNLWVRSSPTMSVQGNFYFHVIVHLCLESTFFLSATFFGSESELDSKSWLQSRDSAIIPRSKNFLGKHHNWLFLINYMIENIVCPMDRVYELVSVHVSMLIVPYGARNIETENSMMIHYGRRGLGD